MTSSSVTTGWDGRIRVEHGGRKFVRTSPTQWTVKTGNHAYRPVDHRDCVLLEAIVTRLHWLADGAA
jgi:hypothetical protein